MLRPAKSSSPSGVLLIEAVLAASVIAVGLVFVSRGFANQLQALRTMGEYDALLALAREQLGAFETARLTGTARVDEEEAVGILTASLDSIPRYAWRAAAQLRDDLGADPQGTPRFSEVTLTVGRAKASEGKMATPRTSGTTVTLSTLWPTSWVSPSWFE